MSSPAITVELLEALLSPDEGRRRPAEDWLKQLSAVDRCQGFVTALTDPNLSQQLQPHLQHMVAVLLRRDILKLPPCSETGTLMVHWIQLLLGMAFNQASLPQTQLQVRTAIADCVAEACAVLSLSLAEDRLAPIVEGILQVIGPLSVQGDVPSLRLLCGLADRAPRAFCESSALGSLADLVNSTSAASAPTTLPVLTELVVTAAIATTRLTNNSAIVSLAAAPKPLDALVIDPESAAAQLGRTCLPSLLQGMSSLISHPEALHATLEQFLQAAIQVPSLLAGDAHVLHAVCQACQAIAATVQDNARIRLLAVQVLSDLCAVGDVKRKLLTPTLRNSLLQGPHGLVAICVEQMTQQIDTDVEAWAADPASLYNDDLEGWDGDEDAVYAEQLLEQLIQTFGSHALQVVLPLVEQLLANATSNDWRMARAALAALRCCLEAAPVSFAPHVPVAVEAGLAFASSTNVRVQSQALLLLGVLLCTNTSKFQDSDVVRENYGARILQTFAQSALSPCTKVSAVACLGMISYCRGGGDGTPIDGERLVVPYLGDVLQALVQGPLSLDLTDSGAVVVKIRAIGAVACLAEASGASFLPFYSNVMPGLLACSQLPNPRGSHEVSQLKGAAIEAATIVGQSLGEDSQEVFLNDARQIMQWAVPILSSDMGEAASGVPMDQLLSACARIASVMGAEYAPYVEAVLPHLLSRASDDADVSISEGDDAGLDATKRHGLDVDEEAGTESVTVALPGRGLTKVTINTSKIQEKAQAARAVYEHAEALGASFGRYAKPCLDTFLLLVRFKYSAEIRATAAQTLAAVFESACAFGEESGMGIPQSYLPLISKAIAQQIQEESDTSDMENLFALADSLSDVYFSVYRRLADYGKDLLRKFSLGDAKTVVQLCSKALVSCLERRANITRTLSGAEGQLTGDDEVEEYRGLLLAEQALLTPLVDSIGCALKFFKYQFVPIFASEVDPVLGPYLQAGDDIRARLSAVCLYDDCVEHCGPDAAARFAPMLATATLLGIDDSTNGHDLELKAASLYGIAQIARYAPSTVLVGYAQGILGRIVSITQAAKPGEEDYLRLRVYENAVSALASLVLIGNAPLRATGYVQPETAVRTFLSNLPLRQDEDEAKICSAGLCDMVEKGTISVQGECRELVRIIGETFHFVTVEGEELATQETCGRLAGILFQMQHQVPNHVMNEAFGALGLDAQEAINTAMQEYADRLANVVSPRSVLK